MLTGRRVRLRPTTADDKDRLIEVRRTSEVWARWRGDDLASEFDDDLADEELHLFTIEGPDGAIVGLIQYAEEEEPDYRHASLDLYIDPAHHRQGFATDAIETLVAHLFDDRGHHRLTIDPAADNRSAIDCYAKVGFVPVGVLRAYERQPDGSWADGLLMDLLADDRARS